MLCIFSLYFKCDTNGLPYYPYGSKLLQLHQLGEINGHYKGGIQMILQKISVVTYLTKYDKNGATLIIMYCMDQPRQCVIENRQSLSSGKYRLP